MIKISLILEGMLYLNQNGLVGKIIIILIILACLGFVIVGFFILQQDLAQESQEGVEVDYESGEIESDSLYQRKSSVQQQMQNIEKEFMKE